MSGDRDMVDILKSIDSTLKAMLKLAQQRTQQVRQAQPKAIASDRDLDGKYGNPIVNFNPRDWSGESFKNARMSECPPDFLDMIAETFDYFASKAEEKDEQTDKGKPIAVYKRADAARARGWAKRNREHGVTTPTAPAATGGAEWAEQPEGWTEEEPSFR